MSDDRETARRSELLAQTDSQREGLSRAASKISLFALALALALRDHPRRGGARSQEKSSDEILWREYTEVCKSHSGITEFRSKLLGFLPFASGAGIFLSLIDQTDATRLAALGLFGCIITLGLFLHERRNINRCWELVERGKTLENDLKLGKGQFTMEHEYECETTSLWRRLWKKAPKETELASWVIYLSVLLAWFCLAGFGMYQLLWGSSGPGYTHS